MSYRVKLTQSAVEQAQEIVQYISETLLVPMWHRHGCLA